MSRQPRKQLEGISYEQFRRQVKGGQSDPLYLFVGEEDYLHDRALQLLYKTVPEEARGFNIDIFRIGSEMGASSSRAVAAIDAANQLPMIAHRRVVVIRDFDKIKEDEIDLVLEYLKRPSPAASVVFQSQSIDQRRKITAALLKACTVVLMERPAEQQLKRWVIKFLQEGGNTAAGRPQHPSCEIDSDALGRLLALAGKSMMRLASEMEKLAAFANGARIDVAAVEALVPRAKDHSSFEIWDAIIERDRPRAVLLTHRLLDDGTDPVMMVGVLAGLLRRMLTAKDLQNKGARPDEIAKATGQYGQRANAFNNRVRATPREEILHGLLRIGQVDNAIKNSEGTPRLQIEYLVAELTLPHTARWGIVR